MATNYDMLKTAYTDLQLIKKRPDILALRKILKREKDEKSDFGYNYHTYYSVNLDKLNSDQKFALYDLLTAIDFYNFVWQVTENTIRPIIMKASVKYYERRKKGEEIALQTFKHLLTEAGVPYDVKPMEVDDLVCD